MDPAPVSGNRVEWLPQACLRVCLHRQGLVDPHIHFIITDKAFVPDEVASKA